MIRALQTLGVFACRCQIEEDSIEVGILLFEQGRTGLVSLVQTDEPEGDTGCAHTSERYEFLIPSDLISPAYAVKLARPPTL
jgi:hypothetical protein